jgi:hypothetical protein
MEQLELFVDRRNLFEKLHSIEYLYKSFKAVKKNKGAPGILDYNSLKKAAGSCAAARPVIILIFHTHPRKACCGGYGHYTRRSTPCAALAVCLCARAAARHKDRGGPPLPARRAGLISCIPASLRRIVAGSAQGTRRYSVNFIF